MHGRIWAVVCGALIGVVLAAAPASAQFSPGARTLGEPYLFLPHIGNGGYDAQHYDVTIDYDPIAHSMVSSADLTARATQALSEFSLDFVSYYTVSSVKVDGVARHLDARRRSTQLQDEAGRHAGRGHRQRLRVPRRRRLQRRRRRTASTPDDVARGLHAYDAGHRRRCVPGSFDVNEPMGAMRWFPNNNHPRDKATYDFHLTAPNAYNTIGNGELASKVVNGDGRPGTGASTTRWPAISRRRRSGSTTTPR